MEGDRLVSSGNINEPGRALRVHDFTINDDQHRANALGIFHAGTRTLFVSPPSELTSRVEMTQVFWDKLLRDI